MHVLCLDNTTYAVFTQYWRSELLDKASANDVRSKFESCLRDLKERKLIQVLVVFPLSLWCWNSDQGNDNNKEIICEKKGKNFQIALKSLKFSSFLIFSHLIEGHFLLVNVVRWFSFWLCWFVSLKVYVWYFSATYVFLLNRKPEKMRNNAFYLKLKVLFVLKIY